MEKVAHRVGIINRGSLVEVSTLSQLKKLAFKHVQVELASSKDAKLPLDLMENVKNLSAQDSSLSFLCSRDSLDAVLSWLKTVPYRDVNIRTSTLEDIFLEYYHVSPYDNQSNSKNKEPA